MVKCPVKSHHIPCKLCGYLVYKLGLLADRMQTHTGERPVKCNACQKTYVNSQGAKRLHKRSSHRSATKTMPAVADDLLLRQIPIADLPVAVARRDPIAQMYHNEDHSMAEDFDNLIAEVAEVAMDRLDKVALGVEKLARECVWSAIGMCTGFDYVPCDVDDLTPTIFFIDDIRVSMRRDRSSG